MVGSTRLQREQATAVPVFSRNCYGSSHVFMASSVHPADVRDGTEADF